MTYPSSLSELTAKPGLEQTWAISGLPYPQIHSLCFPGSIPYVWAVSVASCLSWLYSSWIGPLGSTRRRLQSSKEPGHFSFSLSDFSRGPSRGCVSSMVPIPVSLAAMVQTSDRFPGSGNTASSSRLQPRGENQ